MVKYGKDGFNLLDTDFRKYFDSIPHAGLRAILLKLGMEEVSRHLSNILATRTLSLAYSAFLTNCLEVEQIDLDLD